MARTHKRPRHEWASDEPHLRRLELFVRAAPVFRQYGYHGSTLKALAAACGLSIPGLYRYFPSKRAFALFPLTTAYPELHGPPPEVTVGDPLEHLSAWIEGAVDQMPNYLLASRLAIEAGFTPDQDHRSRENLAAHVAEMAGVLRRAAPRLRDDVASDIASTMVNIVIAPAVTGLEREPAALRRELRALLAGYGIKIARASS